VIAHSSTNTVTTSNDNILAVSTHCSACHTSLWNAFQTKAGTTRATCNHSIPNPSRSILLPFSRMLVSDISMASFAPSLCGTWCKPLLFICRPSTRKILAYLRWRHAFLGCYAKTNRSDKQVTCELPILLGRWSHLPNEPKHGWNLLTVLDSCLLSYTTNPSNLRLNKSQRNFRQADQCPYQKVLSVANRTTPYAET
jgi:hypothetical protein